MESYIFAIIGIRIPTGDTLLTVIIIEFNRSTFRQDVTWLDTKCYITKHFLKVILFTKLCNN